jgi:CRISPR-associated protein Csb2
MPTLLFRFPGRRYHATPWGHHVNEGLVEWPPSPWRVLRALLSVGYTALGWSAAFNEPWRSSPPATARSLIGKLASVLPVYSLPRAVGTHSRHFMPVARFKGGREHTTLVFDTWAQIDDGELTIAWDVALEPEESQLLVELVAHLGYLGRSESWISARVADGDEVKRTIVDCRPCAGEPLPGPGWEQVPLLAPEPPDIFLGWRGERIDAALAALPAIPLPDKKRLTGKDRKPSEQRDAERACAIAPYPDNLISCLQVDTTWLREYGWSQPPASRRVLYWRRSDVLRAPAVTQRTVIEPANAVPFVLLSLNSQSGNDHALPTLARSLPQGEMLHRQMVAARLRIAPESHSRVLTGCDEAGIALRGAHRHAHVLSLDLDDDGHIDHLLVWAPDGLDALDQRALRMTRGTYTRGGVGPLRLAWSAAGQHDDLARFPLPYRDALLRTVGSACSWISATPFVPPRHPKKRGINSLEGQVRAELAARGWPPPQTVQWLNPQHDERARRLRHHVRVRRRGAPPAVDAGYALRLTFAEVAFGPLCLGYASHFGLGRFECAAE